MSWRKKLSYKTTQKTNSIITWAASALLVFATHNFAATTPYAADFESGIGSEWSTNVLDSSQPYYFSTFSGRFVNTNQTLTLTGLSIGSSYTIGFDFYAIDSWDGGGDVFSVTINNIVALQESYANAVAQTNARQPDEGRAHLGFVATSASFVDAIYRNIELVFTATSDTAQISFRAQGLTSVDDESWGIDNVSVNLSTSLVQTTVRSTSLPLEGTTNSVVVDRVNVSTSRRLLLSSATNASNYELREAGANGSFGDGDDAVYTLTSSYTTGKSVRVTFNNSPLQPGRYRFQVKSTLQDFSTNFVAAFTRIFSIAHPTVGRIENTDNGAIGLATVLPMTETPVAGGFITSLGMGTFSTLSELDYWSFNAEAGDRVTARVESQLQGTSPQLSLRNSTDGNLQTFSGGANGIAQIQNFTFSSPGTYYFRVWSDSLISPYRMRVDYAYGSRQLETEANDTPGTANFMSGNYPFRMAGSLVGADPSGDFYNVSTLDVGNVIQATLQLPAGSALTITGVYMAVQIQGSGVDRVTNNTGSLSYTVVSNNTHYVRVYTPGDRDLRSQYVLDINVADVVAPQVTAVSLPAEGTTNTAVIDRFTAGFSEEMTVSAVTNAANYELRGGGLDGALDTGDDESYALNVSYSSGLTASYSVTNGPLQPGLYRFTISTGLTDRAFNPLPAAYVRSFTVGWVTNYFVTENRTNGSQATASSLSIAPENRGAGTFSTLGTVGTSTNPWAVLLVKVNADTNLDLVTANYNGASFSVALGNGNGTFGAVTNYATGVNPVALAAGDLNGDSNLDLVVANDSSINVSVRLGNGDGSFGAVSNYPAGSNPRGVALGDVNGDGKLDLAVANYSSNNVSVRLGNGNGTFGAQTNYTMGTNPIGVSLGDLNGDTNLDLISANYNSADVSVRLGNGNGTFGSVASYAVGNNPREAELGDVNGDGKLDVVTPNDGSASVSVLLGNGNGTFAASLGYAVGNNPYAVALGDVNGDGKLDVAAANSSANTLSVLWNNGDGTFATALTYGVGTTPRGVSMGDVNGDGILDMAVANFSSSTASILLGYRAEILTEDPAGSGVRSGYGRGIRSNSSDDDYWSFYGRAGDLVTIAVDNPGNPGSSSLRYGLNRPEGGEIAAFVPASNGPGQLTPTTLPVTGRYTIRVSPNFDYQGEYRLRVTVVTPPVQLETEANDSVGAANTLTYVQTPGLQSATVAGYIGVADGSGDYFGLGTLLPATVVHLTLSRPSSSSLVATVGLYNASGTLVTNVAGAVTSLTYVVSGGTSFYARVTTAASGAGITAQYVLNVELADVLAPQVTAVSLPAEGTTNSAVVDRFTVSFSEDMSASSVSNLSNYELRGGGLDGALDTGDDESYALNVSYSSGLTASYTVTNGPLQPGLYRFTISTGLTDRALNPLPSPYVRTFTMAWQANYFVTENRTNGSQATASSLSIAPENRGAGTFSTLGTVGTSTNPWAVLLVKVNADTNLDLVTANYNGASFSVALGNGNGTFGAVTNYATGVNPVALAAGDLNGDSNLDLVVANDSSINVSVRLGNGDGSFGAVSNYPAGSNPRGVALGDVNGDGKLDLAVANYSSNNVSVRLGNGNGTFGAQTNYTMGTNPIGVSLGDLNGDTNLDLISANYNSADVSVRLGNGNGTFGSVASYAVGNNPREAELGDVNGDGKLDVVTPNDGSASVSVLLGNGNGTFAASLGYAVGNNPYAVALGDVNGDGKLDVAAANSSANTLSVLWNNGDGTFATALTYGVGTTPRGVSMGDVNGDGILDMAVANFSSSTASILLGYRAEILTEDPAGSGVRSGYGRGIRSNSSDDDYWSFYGRAGDLVTIAVDNPGNPGSSSLRYGLNRPEGGEIAAFVPASNGPGQLTPTTLPVTGRYTIRVSPNFDYQGEYRLRVTVVTPPVQLETEANDSVGAANTLTYVQTPGLQSATVAGYIGVADGSGDYFGLGTLLPATVVHLTLSRPSSSSLVATVGLYNASGTLVTNVAGAVTSLTYVVSGGTSFYARVTTAASGAGITAQYVLNVELADVLAPQVTAVSLPAEGTTNSAVVDRFTVSFSEDMSASSVSNLSNYELRGGGLDGALDTGDDESYALNVSYSSGLTASYTVTNGPLQPGLYRFTISTGLTDRALNPLPSPYVRTFTMAWQANYFVTENRTNGSQATASSLSIAPENRGAGTFSTLGTVGTSTNPWAVLLVKVNADTNLDLVTANYNGASFGVRLGNGDGTFGAVTNYATGNNPVALAAGDINGDGWLDLVTANDGSANLSVRLGNGDGSFGAVSNYPVGSNPRSVALGDLNGDLKLDVVAPDNGTATVSVRTNNGNGTFGAAVSYGVGSAPIGVGLGDLNADGKLDLISANYNSADVSVRLGNGDGTFGSVANYAVGANPRAVGLGDVNGDLKLDVVTPNDGAASVSVLLGNGNGTFAASVGYAVGNNPYAVALGDMNGDGKLDVATANSSANTLSVLLNNGDGTFATAMTYGVGTTPRGVAAGDVNNDGIIDLAVASYSANTVTIFLGNRVEWLTEDPVGSGARSGYGRGIRSNSSDDDYWSFYGRAGDIVTIAVDNPGNPGSSSLRYGLNRPEGGEIAAFVPASNGPGQLTPTTLPVTGRYTIRVSPNFDYQGEYRLRVTVVTPPVQLETEANDSVGAANTLVFTQTPGLQTATVAGYIGVADGNGDYFGLGTLLPATVVHLTLSRPSSSSLVATVGLYNASGTLVTNVAGAVTSLTYVVSGGTSFYARVTTAASGAGITAQYLLNVELADTLAPQVTAVSLPAEATTNTAIIDRFTVSFSEDMSTSSVSNLSNYNLRSGGVDGVLDTGDDESYVLSVSYSSGLTPSYTITNGPLQPGVYRFTISTGLTDRALNPLPATYVRLFTVSWLTNYYVTENRTNGSQTTGTSLSIAPENRGAGTFSTLGTVGTSTNPWAVLLVKLNADTNLDLVTANYNGASFGVALGNGDGTFGAVTNYATGVNPVALAAGDLNGDSNLDLVVANDSSINVSVRLGNGDGSFGAVSNYPAGTNPRGVALGDVNGDGKLDFAVANYSSNNVSVRLGNGNGTFGAQTNYTMGTNPIGVSLGDLNGDTNLDLISANYSSANVSVRLGNGNGTFGAVTNYAVGNNPREAELGDVNGDGKLDVVTPNDGSASVSVLLGNGNGSFAASLGYAVGNNPYAVALADMNGDGKLDVAAANSSANTLSVLMNNGDGTFATAMNYGVGTTPRGVSAGDVNNDGIQDLAVASYSANTVTIFLGNRVEWLTEDPAGSGVRSGYGRGIRSNSSDDDYWSFYGRAGDIVTIAVDNPGNPGSSSLRYGLNRPEGGEIAAFVPASNGPGQLTPTTLPVTGRYTIRVSPNFDYQGEYRLRVTVVTPPVQMETEANNTLATANTLTMATSGNTNSATVAGYISSLSDLDYFSIGFVTNDRAVLLTTHLPSSSGLKPVVALYNAAGQYMSEALSGRDSDGVAEVWVAVPGTYYALVRSGENTGGLLDQYVMDVLTLPTGDLSIPNLQVTEVVPPSNPGIQSGQSITFSWSVSNVRLNSTGVSAWQDRVVLSLNTVQGDGDDILLGNFTHNGVLAGGESYTNTQTITLPDGIAGSYYIIVKADSANAVYESTFENDNVTASANTFLVTLADYPDLKIENLTVLATNEDTGVIEVQWTTANRGTRAITNAFYDRVLINYVPSGATVANVELPVTNAIEVNGTVNQSLVATATLAGTHRVQVTTDNRSQIYEFDAVSHDSAENNAVTVNTEVVRYYNVSVATNPAGWGTASGAGRFLGGTSITAVAQANTNIAPYRFDRWTEGGVLVTTNASYTFTLTSNRNLTANFVLPTFQVSVIRQPTEGGSVSGVGTYTYGTTNILQATLNAGYGFRWWLEGTNVVSTSLSITNVIVSDHTFTAVFYELNPFHNVTTATSPTNLTTVTGAGFYTNGQTGSFSTTAVLTNGATRYTLLRFTLNGAFFSSASSFNKVFSTVDPSNMLFTAEYTSQSVVPQLLSTTANYTNPVPSVTNFQVTLVFDRTMNIGVEPLLVFSNTALGLSRLAPTNGTWFKTTSTNDSYRTPVMAFTNYVEDGTYTVTVSRATDVFAIQIASTNALVVQVSTVPPGAPAVTNYPPPPAISSLRTTSVTLQGTRDTNTAVWINNVERVTTGSDPWSYALSGLTQGTNVVTVFARSPVGNVSTSVTVRFYVDSVAPAVTAVSPANNGYTNSPTATVRLTYTEATSGLDAQRSAYSVIKSGFAVAGDWSVTASNLTFTPAAALIDGVYNVSAQLIDLIGNTGSVFSSSFTVDAVAPAVPKVNPVTSPTTISIQTITGTREANSAIYRNGALVAALSSSTNWSHVLTLTNGQNTSTYTARDSAGNESAGTNTVIQYANVAPGAVTVTAQVFGVGTTITLGWSAYDELANGGDIANYTIFQSGSSFTHVNQATQIGTSSAGQKSFVVTGLVRGATKYYAVIARDSTGLADSNVTSMAATPVDTVAPPNPTGAVFVSGATNLVMTWSASSNPDADLAGYRVYVTNAPTPSTYSPTTLSHTQNNLQVLSFYQFRVSAFDNTGNEGAGLVVTGYTLLPNPQNLVVVPYDGYAELSWLGVTPAANVKHYAIYAATNNYTTVSNMTPRLTVTTTNARLAGLQNYVTNFFAVTTVNKSDGETKEVTTVPGMTEDDTLGPTVSNLLWNLGSAGATITAPGSFRVTARDPSGVASVEFRVDGSLVGTDSIGPTNFTTFWDVSSTSNDGAHALEVRAYDTKANVTVYATNVNVVLATLSAPAITSPVPGTVVNHSSVSVSGTGALYASYAVVNINGQLSTGATLTINSAGRFSGTADLSEGTNILRVAAVNRAGTGSLSVPVTIVYDASIPPAPIGLYASPRADGQIQLGWVPVANMKGYYIYRSMSSFTTTNEATRLNATPLASQFYQDLPAADGLYYYRVSSVNLAGTESLLSQQATAASDRTPPDVLSIEYITDGPQDIPGNRFGRGNVQVRVNLSEELQAVPFFSINAANGSLINITLRADSANGLLYTGSFRIDESTACGTAYAVFSGRDKASNRGTTIALGGTLVLDSCGPVLTDLSTVPTEPIRNSAANPTTVVVTATFSANDLPVGTPQLSYRLSQTSTNVSALSIIPLNGQTWSATLTLPSTAGQPAEYLEFFYQGVDDLGNTGTTIAVDNRFQVYQGSLPPLDAPSDVTAQALPGGQVRVQWSAVPGAEDYAVFKGPTSNNLSFLARSMQALEYTENAGDTTIWYAVASVRQANSQTSTSALSRAVRVIADTTAPAAPTNLRLLLAGNGLFLTWQKVNESNIVYDVYRAATCVTSIGGLTAVVAGVTTTNALDTHPIAGSVYYAVVAKDPAGNESQPSSCAHTNLSLLPINSLAVRVVQGELPVIRWSHPQPQGINGYNLYLGEGENPSLLSGDLSAATTSYVDAGYSGDSRYYTIAARETAGTGSLESIRRSVLLPKISLTRATNSLLKRGIMNRVSYTVFNDTDTALTGARLKVSVVGRDHLSESFSLAGRETRIVDVVVGGYTNLPDVTTLSNAFLCTAVQGDVEIVSMSDVQVIDDHLVADIANDELNRGAQGNVRFELQNTTTEQLELITAISSGNADSPDIRVKLENRDGNVLAVASLRQSLGAQVTTVGGGVTLARIEPGDSFTSGNILLNVPTNAPTDVRLRLEIDALHYRYGDPEHVVISGLVATRDVPLGDTTYYAEVTNVSPAVAFGVTNITITGRAVNRGTGLPQQNVAVKLVIELEGFERSYTVQSDAFGNWSSVFTPLANESGLYHTWAVHPSVVAKPVQAQFVISRVTIVPAIVNLSLARSSEFSVPATITTSRGLALTNVYLSYEQDAQPGGVFATGVQITATQAVPFVAEGKSATLTYSVRASNNAPASATMVLRLRSDNGPVQGWGTVTINGTFSEPLPSLQITPSYVNTGVAVSNLITESVVLRNKGFDTATGVAVALETTNGAPAPSWVTLNSAAQLGDFLVGQEKPIGVTFAPTGGVAEAVYTFRLAVTSSNSPGTFVPLYVSVDGSGRGGAIFKVADIYTGTSNQFGGIIQGLAGARITLDRETGLVFTTNKVTDTLGEADFSDLPEGSYVYRVTGPTHSPAQGRLWVRPGVVTPVEIQLQITLVTIEWSVVPIALEDRYDIVLHAVFSTEVPAPVVVIDPPSITLPDDMAAGDVFNGELKFVNYGLIRAQNVFFTPRAENPEFKFELMRPVPETLEAKEVLRIPYRITRLGAVNNGGSGGGAPCVTAHWIDWGYAWVCINGVRESRAAGWFYLQRSGNCGGTGIGFPVTWGYSSGPGTGPGGGGPGVSRALPTSLGRGCTDDPCENDPDPCCKIRAQQKVHSEVQLTTGGYFDDMLDFWVKVQGGTCGVQRTYSSGAWHFTEARGSYPFIEKPGAQSVSTDAVAVVRYQHGTNGYLTGILDHFTNQVLWLEYISVGGSQKLSRVYDVRNRSVSYQYDTSGRLTNFTDVIGNATRYSYDSRGRLSSKVLPDGQQIPIAYDDYGYVSLVGSTRFDYGYDEGRSTFYASVTPASGVVSERWFDSGGGQVRQAVSGLVLFDAALPAASVTWPQITTNEHGNITRVELEDGRTRTYEYNGPGYRLTRIQDERGAVTLLAYDGSGRLTNEIFAAGSSLEHSQRHTYDAVGNELTRTVVGAAGQSDLTWIMAYDQAGNVISETDPWGNVTSNTYDNLGGVLVATTPEGHVWRNTYEARGLRVSVLDPEGRVVSNSYDAAGRLVWMRDEAGQTTTWNYSSNGVLTSVVNAWGQTSHLEYNSAGKLVRLVDFDGTEKRYEYDSDGKLIAPAVDGVSVTRDAEGRVIKMTYPDGTQVTQEWDAQGRLSRIVRPRSEIVLSYDNQGRLVDEVDRAAGVSRTNRWEYDAHGDLSRRIDPLGRETRYEYDLLGRMTRVVDPLDHASEATFSPYGNVSTMTDEQGSQVLFELDLAHQIGREIRPDGGTRTLVSDRRGLARQLSDSSGRNMQVLYDAWGRPTNATFSASGGVQAITASFTRDAHGRLTGYSDGTISGSIEYNDMERTQRTTVDFGTFSKTIEVGYDKSRRVIRLVDPNGAVVTCARDALGNLTSMTVPGAGVIGFHKGAIHSDTEITYPGGLRQVLEVDGFEKVATNRVLDPGGNAIMNRTYGFRTDGRLAAVLSSDEDRAYDYDAAGHLTSAALSAHPSLSETYTYDATANRLSSSGTNATWTYTNWNRLVTWPGGSYQYDAAGRVTQRSVGGTNRVFEYDAVGRLATVKDNTSNIIARYVYDSLGRRVGKMTAGTTNWYLYGPNGLIAEYDGAGQAIREYGYRPDDSWMTAPLWMRQQGEYFFFVNDPFGGADRLVRYNGETAWQATETASGRMVSPTGVTNPMRASGQFFDEESGLHYNGVRFYDPETGRYLTPDPLGYGDGMNLYQFCWADPVNYDDPLGLYGSASPIPEMWDAKTCTWKKYCDSLRAAKRAADLAEAVYDFSKTPPGFTKIDQRDIGLSGFQAATYKDDDGNIWISYRGTQPWSWNETLAGDLWWADALGSVLPGFVPGTQQSQARDYAQYVQQTYGTPVAITGHSLGGDLAANGNYALGGNIPTITFNSKGSLLIPNSSSIQSYYVEGEGLTRLNEKDLLSPIVPNALGMRIPLSPEANSGFLGWGRHGMNDSVQKSIDAALKKYCSNM